MQTVIGRKTKEAVAILSQQGYTCELLEYAAQRPVETDTQRVVALRQTGENTVVLVVCGFKTQV